MKALLMLGCLLLCGRCHAQFSDSVHHYINLSATGIVNKTDAGSHYVLNNSMKFNIERERTSFNATHAWIYGRSRNNLSNNDFFSAADFSFLKKRKKLYAWALAVWEKSVSLKINHRLQTGAGLGYYVVARENLDIQVSDGILYETSDLYDTETSLHDYETFRNSLRLKMDWNIRKIIVLHTTNFLQHALSDADDYIVRSNTTCSVKLKKWLSLTVALTYNKIKITGRENLLLNYGITLDHYF